VKIIKLYESHGLRHHRIYSIYVNMKTRCYNPKVKKYERYGGRGIKICEEWLDSFKAFYDWSMNNGYSSDLTIDRIDNDGNYEPGNCRWITSYKQASNKSTTNLLTLNGKTQCVKAWTEERKLGKETIRERLKRGWTVENAILTTVKGREGDYLHV